MERHWLCVCLSLIRKQIWFRISVVLRQHQRLSTDLKISKLSWTDQPCSFPLNFLPCGGLSWVQQCLGWSSFSNSAQELPNDHACLVSLSTHYRFIKSHLSQCLSYKKPVMAFPIWNSSQSTTLLCKRRSYIERRAPRSFPLSAFLVFRSLKMTCVKNVSQWWQMSKQCFNIQAVHVHRESSCDNAPRKNLPPDWILVSAHFLQIFSSTKTVQFRWGLRSIEPEQSSTSEPCLPSASSL